MSHIDSLFWLGMAAGGLAILACFIALIMCVAIFVKIWRSMR